MRGRNNGGKVRRRTFSKGGEGVGLAKEEGILQECHTITITKELQIS